jgi:hypothetical protein
MDVPVIGVDLCDWQSRGSEIISDAIGDGTVLPIVTRGVNQAFLSVAKLWLTNHFI